MSQKTSVFITGATGYIGGAILHLLLQQSDLSVSALVRGEENAKKLKSLNVEPILGSLDSTDIIVKAASQADIVINTANVDHIGSAQAIIDGLRKRGSVNGKKPILLHTSGTAVLNDPPLGERSETFRTESDLGNTEGSIALDAPHRDVDILVLNASKTGDVDIAIICPCMIYGVAEGNTFNQRSQQIPLTINAAIKEGKVYYVGKGKHVWNNVHVLDLADLFLLLLRKIQEGKAPIGTDGYYFAENGENDFIEITTAISNELKKNGLQAEPASSEGKEFEIWGNFAHIALGYNSRGKAEKARTLGWKPSRPSLVETIPEEVQYRVQKNKA
ncbi:NAD(P)-binding protein [Acrasis kona]|uniref:NAD(P)-binding protein n=1 Tax=Acrasis kona TaxID=1008807 RepID=A0AAW2ZCA7_9EUKA